MKKKELISKIAKLESIDDQLISEIEYLDQLVRQIGFEEGLTTLKTVALEIIDEIDCEEPPYAI